MECLLQALELIIIPDRSAIFAAYYEIGENNRF
jgi:hypothetical protein